MPDGGLIVGSRVVELAEAFLVSADEADDASPGDVESGEVGS
jgi:hypothetical protein